jgi:hypothetical protein
MRRLGELVQSFPVGSDIEPLYSVTRSMLSGDSLRLFGKADTVIEEFRRYVSAEPSEVTISVASHLFMRLAERGVRLPSEVIEHLMEYSHLCLSEDLMHGIGKCWVSVPRLTGRILTFVCDDVVRIHGSESESFDFTDENQMKARFGVLEGIMCKSAVDWPMTNFILFLERLLDLSTVDWVSDTVKLACGIVRTKFDGISDLLIFLVAHVGVVGDWCPELREGILKIIFTAVCTHSVELGQWPGRTEFVMRITNTLFDIWKTVCLEDELFVIAEILSVFVQLGWLLELGEVIERLEAIGLSWLSRCDPSSTPAMMLGALDLCLSIAIARGHRGCFEEIDIIGIWGDLIENGRISVRGVADRHMQFLVKLRQAGLEDSRCETLVGMIESSMEMPMNPSLSEIVRDIGNLFEQVAVQVGGLS